MHKLDEILDILPDIDPGDRLDDLEIAVWRRIERKRRSASARWIAAATATALLSGTIGVVALATRTHPTLPAPVAPHASFI